MLKARIALAAAVALLLGAVAGSAHAQTSATTNFTLQPGGSATVTFEAFCTNFGQKFPISIQAPNGLASNNVRGGLAYIQSNNLAADQNAALEAQYGIWQLTGATNSPTGGDQSRAVVNAGGTAPSNPDGTSVVDAAKSGQVTVTLDSWQAIGQPVAIGSTTDNFYGRGTLTIKNTSQQALTLFMPVGTLFPPATAGEQTMAGYATNVQVSNPQPAESQQAPQQLPNTAGRDSMLPLAIVAVLALLLAGLQVRRRSKLQ